MTIRFLFRNLLFVNADDVRDWANEIKEDVEVSVYLVAEFLEAPDQHTTVAEALEAVTEFTYLWQGSRSTRP